MRLMRVSFDLQPRSVATASTEKRSGPADASHIQPSYDQAQSMDPLEQDDERAGDGSARYDTIMCLFKRGWASSAQIDAGRLARPPNLFGRLHRLLTAAMRQRPTLSKQKRC